MLTGALIGYGYWGPNVAKQLHVNKNINFKAICDKKPDRIEKARTLYLEQVSYGSSSDKIIADPEIDAVFLAVETSAHYDLTKKALLAGKHVYVEKPFTSTVAEAIELKKIAEDRNLIIHVDHIMVFHPAIKMIKKYLQSGDIGEIIYIDASRMNLGQIKNDVSSMWDLAVHDLSIIDYLTDGASATYINAMGEKMYSTTETLTYLTVRYSHIIVHVKSSWISPLKERKLIIGGTRKMVVFDDMKVDEKLMIYDKGVDFVVGANTEYRDYAVRVRTGDLLVPAMPVEDALYNSIDHFYQSVKNQTPSLSGPAQAIRIQDILEKADQNMH